VSVGSTVMGFARAAGVMLVVAAPATWFDTDTVAAAEYFGADVLEPIATPTDAGVFVAFADPVLWLLLPVEEVPVPVCGVSALATADPLASAAPIPRLTAPAPSQLNA